MEVYEMSHLFYRFQEELILDARNLGLYYSPESARKAIEHFNTQPGFCDNQDAYSIREREVTGTVVDDTVYEVLVYIHSEDYEYETSVELGLYGDEVTAQKKLDRYCNDNETLLSVQNLVFEKLINKYFTVKL